MRSHLIHKERRPGATLSGQRGAGAGVGRDTIELLLAGGTVLLLGGLYYALFQALRSYTVF